MGGLNLLGLMYNYMFSHLYRLRSCSLPEHSTYKFVVCLGNDSFLKYKVRRNVCIGQGLGCWPPWFRPMLLSPDHGTGIGTTMIAEILAWACLVWYLFILTVCSIGVFQMYSRLHSMNKPSSVDKTLDFGTLPRNLHRPRLQPYPLTMSPTSQSFGLSRISSLTFTLVSRRRFSKNTPAKS